MSNKKKHLDLLQVYRGLASLSIVITHNVNSIKYYHNFNNLFLNFIGQISKYGIDFFFVLSGFIISYTSISKVDKKGMLNDYLKSRFLRIYVPYLPIGIAIYLIYILLPNFSNTEREISVITSFTLYPEGRPALSVAWTLTFEILFYIFYSLRFFSKNIFRIVLLFWVCLIVSVNFFIPESVINNGPFYKTITSFYNIEFLLGILLTYILFKKIKINYYLNICFILIFGFIFICLEFLKITVFGFFSNLIFTCLAFLIIHFTVLYKNINVNNKNILMIVGSASYSIYLVHNNIQALITRFFPKITIEVRVVLILLTSIMVSCLIGYIYSFIFEKKLTNFLRKRFIK